MRFLKHPHTGEPDMFITLSTLAVISAIIRFLFEGADIVVFGHTLFAHLHTDPSSYALFLTPVLGSHSYLERGRKYELKEVKEAEQ